jgi:hypothetical protein
MESIRKKTKKKSAIPAFKTRGQAIEQIAAPREIKRASAEDMEAMMIGYRIATNEPRHAWKDRLAEVPEQLMERVRDYLRWAWTLKDFEVHP